MATKVFYDKNDNVLSCTVIDEDGVADETATVTAVTVDVDGEEVEAGLTLTHSAAGLYEAVPDESLHTLGEEYTAQITVVGTDSEDGYIELDFKVFARKA